MKEIYAQVQPGYKTLRVTSDEYAEELRSFHPNQILRIKAYGTTKSRSVIQHRWAMAMIRQVMDNIDDPAWSGINDEKRRFKACKAAIKREIKFFESSPEVKISGETTFVFFELRSFAFADMDPDEANRVYNDVKIACAGRLGISPEELETEAQQE